MLQKDFVMERIEAMKKDGYSEKEIADFFGLTTMQLRQFKSSRHLMNRVVYAEEAKKLKEEGKSVSEIAQELGKEESSVRLLLEFDPKEALKKQEEIKHRIKAKKAEKTE